MKFIEDAKPTEDFTKKNKDAVKSLSVSITIKENESGKIKNYEAQEITNVSFKDRKNKIFVRFKIESGIIVSIPKGKMPNFIKIETEETKVW